MAHERQRHIAKIIAESQKFWPVTGVIGARQVGKTTLIRDQVSYQTYKTLDDDDTRSLANQSAKIFLAQYERPLVIDEVTKAPDLFDGIKSIVDKKRIPNQFLITGSTQFSSKLNIRESLTGRIGMVVVNPLSISEAHSKNALIEFSKEKQHGNVFCKKIRFSLEEIIHHAKNGGFPVPMFIREKDHADQYWLNWLETTIYRDVARFFKSNFDPEYAFELIREITKALSRGELATLSNINLKDSRKIRRYLEVFESVFLVKRVRQNHEGVGTDSWILVDSGLVYYLLKRIDNEETLLSIVRHFLWNETSNFLSLTKEKDERTYYKSAKGSPVDWVWDGVPYKIVTSLKSIGWEEKALIGAMKKLKSKTGFLVAPVDEAINPSKLRGIGILPWANWS